MPWRALILFRGTASVHGTCNGSLEWSVKESRQDLTPLSGTKHHVNSDGANIYSCQSLTWILHLNHLSFYSTLPLACLIGASNLKCAQWLCILSCPILNLHAVLPSWLHPLLLCFSYPVSSLTANLQALWSKYISSRHTQH